MYYGDVSVLLTLSLWAIIMMTHSYAEEDPAIGCPYKTNHCTASTSNTSCCMTCFCSKFCWSRDDCCADAPPPPDYIATSESAMECVPSSHNYVKGGWSPRLTDGLVYISMVSRCIGPAKNHPFADRCLVTSDASVVDMIPVWSNVTRDVYHNMYCAICHGVTNYNSFIVNLGTLNAYLTPDKPVNWYVIDYVVRHVTSDDVFLRATPQEYMRNEVQICKPILTPCKRVLFAWDLVSVSYGLSPVTFTALIDVAATHGDERRACGETEILDPYMHICRPLVCPELSLAYNGDCYYTRIDNTSRTASLRVTVTADHNMYSMPSLLSGLMVERFLAFSGTWFSRYLCGVEVAIDESQNSMDAESRDYFLSVGFQNNSKIHTSLKHVQYANELISSSTDIVLGLNLITHFLKGIDARSYQYADTWHYLDPCNGIFQVVKVWCPTVELSEADFRYALLHKILPETFEVNNPGEVAGNHTVARQICSRDYLQAWMNTSSPSSTIYMCHIFLMLLCYLFISM